MKTQIQQRYLIALIGLFLASCSANPPQAGVRAVPVPIANVESGTITDSSDYVANMESRQSVTLQPRVSGYVQQIFVKAGDAVKAGSPILLIDSSQQQALVQQVNAAAATTEAELQSAKATLNQLLAQQESIISSVEFNKAEFKRYTQLTLEGATSKQKLDEVSNELRAANSQLGQIKAQIKSQQANINSAEKRIDEAKANVGQQSVQLNYYTIEAPFTGTVGDIPVKIGDFVNNSTPLTTITQNQVLEVQVAVPVENAPRLRQGMIMEILNAQNQPVASGRVFFIAPSINQQTQSVLVKANFNNEGNKLRANQFVRARLIWDTRTGVLVPTSAISRLGGQDFIFVAESKGEKGQLVAVQKPIKLGKITSNKQEVLSGLEAKDKIVISGILQLRDGVPIAPAETK
ncbi:efflux RND transporter periplasmic adaptor subunit [Synechococcus sp. PCC 7502]|uniref:efflux RND transporter periplasmic adaptor subunit n=1 Tax=Synechococcus sp. PCC 7502 TaxID=1173263 RepID=UPI001181A370|nr:efflux RND transporter periplasmic adaptor subunit [Synechococcus sp. PCC 7502]